MRDVIRTLSALFLLALSASSSHGQSIQNAAARPGMSLNGKWQYIVDPFETGFYNYRYQENPNGFFKAARPKGKDDFVEYGFDASSQLNVPGDWNSQAPELLYYEGTIWYHRNFSLQRAADKRYILHFGAVNYVAHVYVNGQKAGMHEGGFTPFSFDVTEHVRDGDNFIVVKADNRRGRENIPTVNTDWWNYGGITRDVRLLALPRTFIADYAIQLKKNSPAEIEGWIRTNGPTPAGEAVIEIPELKVSRKVRVGDDGVARFTFPAKPALWSPANPRRYQVTVRYRDDAVSDMIGFRTIAVSGEDILLNGKPVFLRGVCIHEEIPQRRGRAHSESDARMLLTWAKEMGCNYVRLAHYPHNENMVRVADEMGLMVWSEIPVYWTIQFDNPAVLAKALAQLEEMITRDRNRASVVLWSVANETPVGPSRNAFLQSLIGRARELDPTRLITAALEVKGWQNADIELEDPAGEWLDVLGCNEYAGWYVPWRDELLQAKWSAKWKKPLIISEFGGEALYGNHGDKDVASSWSEEHQEQLYQRQIAMFRQIGFLRGTTPWILADFRSPKRLLPGYQDGWNRKGLISENGDRKKAYFVMKKFYEQLAAEGK